MFSRVVWTIARRWISVVLLAGVGALFLHLAMPWAWAYLLSVRIPASINPLALRATRWLVFVFATYIALGIVPVRLGHLRSAHRYPPLWLGAPLSALLAWAGHRFVSDLRFDDAFVAAMWPRRLSMLIGAVAAGAALRAFVHRPISGSDTRPRSVTSPRPSEQKLDWTAIHRWAEAEEPATEDLFGHRPIATRFASVLSNEKVLWRRSAALVGPWGSGKTTILRWVEGELKETPGPKVWSCWIGCWGIEDSRFLAAHVLREIVETVDSHVDAIGLRGIPDAYLRMLGATSFGAAEWLFRRDHERDILDDLEKVVPILEAASARIVVFIEDADRAASEGFDPGHLERVIWRLRDLERISCVIALDPERVKMDLSRLCEHIELMPVFDVDAVREVLSLTRDHCLEDYKFIRPVRKATDRDRLDLKLDDGGSLLKYVRRHHDSDVCDTIADVRLIRFRGHLPKGGYDGQNGIKQSGTTCTTTVLGRVQGRRRPAGLG